MKTRLYWFQDDNQPADRDHQSEENARQYAAARSSQVQGRCDVLRAGQVIARYEGGELIA
jgi:hypothetical protein